jgi:hypothetical protein
LIVTPEQDERVTRLKTPEDCEQFANNVEARGKPDLARAARRRAVELRALALKPNSAVERELLEAVYAYERVQSQIRKRKFRATRTWQAIQRSGIIQGVERIVGRPIDAEGIIVLVELGMEDLSFEAVILRHPESFSPHVVERSRERLQALAAS